MVHTLVVGNVVNLVRQLSYAVRQVWSVMTEGKVTNEEAQEQLGTSGGNGRPKPEPTEFPPREGLRFGATADLPWYLERAVQQLERRLEEKMARL